MTCTSLLFGGEKNKWFLSRVSLILYLSFSLSFSISLRLFHFLFFLPPFLVWLFTEKTLWLVSISDKTNKQLVKLQKKTGIKSDRSSGQFLLFLFFFLFFVSRLLCLSLLCFYGMTRKVHTANCCMRPFHAVSRLTDFLMSCHVYLYSSGIRLYLYNIVGRIDKEDLICEKQTEYFSYQAKVKIPELMNLSSESWFFYDLFFVSLFSFFFFFFATFLPLILGRHE